MYIFYFPGKSRVIIQILREREREREREKERRRERERDSHLVLAMLFLEIYGRHHEFVDPYGFSISQLVMDLLPVIQR